MRFLRPVVLSALALAFTWGGVSQARAAGLTAFNGKRSGLLLVAQGDLKTGARVLGTAVITTTATASTAKFVVEGAIGDAKYKHVIALVNGKITYSTTLPGITSGDFPKPMSGTYRGGGTRISTSARNDTGSNVAAGSIQLINFGSTVLITTKVTPNVGSPVYVTITGT